MLVASGGANVVEFQERYARPFAPADEAQRPSEPIWAVNSS
jgi:hypothetical protein